MKFDYYKISNEKKTIPAVKEIGEERHAQRIATCGDFIRVVNCESCGTKHFGGSNRCKSRWCLNCMHWRLVCWMRKLIPVFEVWYEEGNYISMLNFTVRDDMPLEVPMVMLEKSFRKIYNDTKKKRERWNERFPGGIRSLEVKIGKNSKMWHPHYHCLVMQRSGEFVKDYDWLSDDWHKIVGHNGNEVTRKDGKKDMDWNGNVFIKKVSNYKSKHGKSGLMLAVCETLKYIVKVDREIFGLPDEPIKSVPLFREAFNTLRGKRQTSSWGLLYNLEKEVDEDMETQDEDSVKDFICQRCGCTRGALEVILYKAITEETVLYDIPSKYDAIDGDLIVPGVDFQNKKSFPMVRRALPNRDIKKKPVEIIPRK
jgi:plasmid rolling circle replication initiator protein Rep